MNSRQTPSLLANYFDGTSAQAHTVSLRLDAGYLHILGEGIGHTISLEDVEWPERTRHGKRVAYLKRGGCIQGEDGSAWDTWLRDSGKRDGVLVKVQQSWRGVTLSMVALIVLVVFIQQWGLPMASRILVAVLPVSLDAALGDASLASLDAQLMHPSELPLAQQNTVREVLQATLGTLPSGMVPDWKLAFRKSGIGPNALALPGGTLIVTDDLVELLHGETQVMVAILAHEMGHLQHRHGVRMLVQATALGALSAVILGDFSAILAGVPVILVQAGYSRQAELEADAQAVRILRQVHISPAVMVTLFERLDQRRQKLGAQQHASGNQDSWLGIAFASHPTDAQRVQFFQDAAAH